MNNYLKNFNINNYPFLNELGTIKIQTFIEFLDKLVLLKKEEIINIKNEIDGLYKEYFKILEYLKINEINIFYDDNFSEFFINKFKNSTLSKKFWYIQEIFKENFNMLFKIDIDFFYQILFECKYITVFDYLIIKDKTISNEKKLELIKNNHKLMGNHYLIFLLKYIKENEDFKKVIKKSLEEIKNLPYFGIQYYHQNFLGIIYIENTDKSKTIKKLIRKIEKMDETELEKKYMIIKFPIFNKINLEKEEENHLDNDIKNLNKFIKEIYSKKRKREKDFKKIKRKYDLTHEIKNLSKNDLEYHHIVPIKFAFDNKHTQKLKEKIITNWGKTHFNIEEKKLLEDKINKYFKELNNANNLFLIKKEIHQYIHKEELFLIKEINQKFVILSDLNETQNLKMLNNKDCFYKNKIDKISNYNKVLMEKFVF